jgi:hypothetical protein
MMEESPQSARILEQLDGGEISVEEALEQITSLGPEMASERQSGAAPVRMRGWWAPPLIIGLVMIMAGAGLGNIGGLWMVLAIPSIILGFLLCLYSVFSFDAPWVHVRIDTGEQTWPKRISLAMPIPARLISWAVKAFGRWFPGLEARDVDLLLQGLEESISPENPIVVEITEGDSAERVKIYIG